MSWKVVLRFASLAAVLLAGSCASPVDNDTLMADGTANHPIIVEPGTTSIKLPFSARDAGLMPEDSSRLDEFVSDYIEHGSGSISISAPGGRDGSSAIRYFGERLSAMGIPPSHILVGQRDDADERVEISYVSYQAKADDCGDWDEDVTHTFSNRPTKNFGCAVQHNIAAMVSDPRDLVGPRPMDAADATRRSTVMGHYEKGEPTPATKGPDQSGAVSNVGK